MRVWVAMEQTTHFVERLVALLLELTVAAAVIVGAVFVGHELNAWRDWYWGAYLHPTQVPQSAPETTEP
jgi:hypothetical protein